MTATRPADRTVALLLLPALAVGVLVLRAGTMAETDQLVPGTATRISFEVDRRDGAGSADDARTLWAVCSRVLTPAQRAAELEVAVAGRASVTVSPAVGEHQTRRLRGCMEDATLDRVLARVTELRDVAPSA